jgi:3-oxoacyl-[acyl-carrier-protein] synthase II
MKIYIRSASCISPQETFHEQLFSSDAKEYNTTALKVIEPDYKNIFDTKQMRRMSRIVRIGLAAAINALKEAGKENADAIITGTAYGCMQDSESFLKKIVEQDEQLLSPTSFIQSTHNTVGAQIALALKCYNYNNTFVHRGFSFEHALIDAMLMLNENEAKNILTGSADEMTDFTFSILKRFGLYKQSPVSNFSLYDSNTKGSVCGEGAAFFLLSNEYADTAYAQLDAVSTLYNPANKDVISTNIQQFLLSQHIDMNDIDLIITGKNGDKKNDALYNSLQQDIFKNKVIINYKHLCGEYPTSSSFALWFAANVIKQNCLPKCFENSSVVNNFKRILIYTNSQWKYQSLILLSACN